MMNCKNNIIINFKKLEVWQLLKQELLAATEENVQI